MSRSKPAKTRVVGVRIPDELYDHLLAYTEAFDITKSEAVCTALLVLLKKDVV